MTTELERDILKDIIDEAPLDFIQKDFEGVIIFTVKKCGEMKVLSTIHPREAVGVLECCIETINEQVMVKTDVGH